MFRPLKTAFLFRTEMDELIDTEVLLLHKSAIKLSDLHGFSPNKQDSLSKQFSETARAVL